MADKLDRKLKEIRAYLSALKTAALAFSGGVDSTLLLYLLKSARLKKCIAVTADSETYSSSDLKTASSHARRAGEKHLIIETSEIKDPDFFANTPRRCYHCKRKLFSEVKKIARKNGIENVLDGSNIDEEKDHRPGMKAAREMGVISPFREMRWGKRDIRRASKQLGIPGWDRPQTVCLASRVPYGTSITTELLERIGRAEHFLKSLGYDPVRVRSRGDEARIEVEGEKIEELVKPGIREKITRELTGMGFKFIAVDIEGFSSGKMNRLI